MKEFGPVWGGGGGWVPLDPPMQTQTLGVNTCNQPNISEFLTIFCASLSCRLHQDIHLGQEARDGVQNNV